MIDILLISANDERAREIAARLGESGLVHNLVTEAGAAKNLARFSARIAKADLLIIDDDTLALADLGAVEEMIAHAPRLACMLVTPALSTDMLMAAMRAGVRHVLNWPLDTGAFARELSHVASKKSAHTRRSGRVISFTSAKGGSGTTLIATNLAHVLATARDQRVLVIDLAQQFADASVLLSDVAPPATLYDLCKQIDRLDAAFFEACVARVHPNLDVLAGAGDPIKAAELRPSHLQRVLGLVRDQYDMVICDIGQSINPLSIHALDHSEPICLVLQQNVPNLHASRRLLDILAQLGYPHGKTRLIVNHYDKREPVGLDAIERALGTKPAHLLPHDYKSARHAANQGQPLYDAAKGGALTKSIEALATLLCPPPPAAEKGVFGRLFASKAAAPVHQLKPSH
jgi:pilus assembly protein CpaE